MNDYDFFPEDYETDEFSIPHLPLDWNEDLSLEEYLERMQGQSENNNTAT
ncbi:hypothetical protein CLV84_2712 [Neolewinella xylanilytica]|uniref:Uncharacterized protein n=1 Tax=Neolewinella xylanilytica TaxID=1514080 RepID=A0A2S6I3R4_9BACT|nr:hypothetical protein [Neolewinella xylanilytica]PPK85805.1 hypothetical protein CLV84_2712 [Neolewinella xylanilytica]